MSLRINVFQHSNYSHRLVFQFSSIGSGIEQTFYPHVFYPAHWFLWKVFKPPPLYPLKLYELDAFILYIVYTVFSSILFIFFSLRFVRQDSLLCLLSYISYFNGLKDVLCILFSTSHSLRFSILKIIFYSVHGVKDRHSCRTNNPKNPRCYHRRLLYWTLYRQYI